MTPSEALYRQLLAEWLAAEQGGRAMSEEIDFETDDFFFEEETEQEANERMTEPERQADERWLLSFTVTPKGQPRAFPLEVEFSRKSEALAHQAKLEAEPECSRIALTRLIEPAPPRCGLCGFDLEAGEEIVCDRCHQRQVKENSR